MTASCKLENKLQVFPHRLYVAYCKLRTRVMKVSSEHSLMSCLHINQALSCRYHTVTLFKSRLSSLQFRFSFVNLEPNSIFFIIIICSFVRSFVFVVVVHLFFTRGWGADLEKKKKGVIEKEKQKFF